MLCRGALALFGNTNRRVFTVSRKSCAAFALLLLVGLIYLPFLIFAGSETSVESPPRLVFNTATRGPVKSASLLGVSLGGGGLRAMTGAMAVGRTIARLDAWETVTHLSSNSGGSWFTSNLLFSAPFYEAVSGKGNWSNTGIDDVVNELGDRYLAQLNQSFEEEIFSYGSWEDVRNANAATNGGEANECAVFPQMALGSITTGIGFPLTDWLLCS